jgi:heme-degrading monooxygenase HmoA
MIAVLFEVRPALKDEYLELAAALRPRLDALEGFLSIERFQSLTDPGKLLSLSFFRDEAAVRRWRETAAHRAAQARGREVILADYRLRVAQVVRDYGMRDRAEAPPDSRIIHG